MLNNFSSQQGAWKHCLFFLANSANQYVSMYSLTTIEKLITKQWLGLMWEERAQLKATLYQLTLENHHTVPHFIRNKLVKLVVDIARLDWPHFYPDFFTNILQQIGHVKKEKGKARSGGWSSGGRGLLGEQCPQLTVSDQLYAGLLNVEFKGLDLIQSPDNTTLGLVFLLTASEELVYPWEDLSVARKDELKRLLLAYMPQVFNILTVLLETLIQKQRHRVTATPPPSPTHGQPNASSPVHSGSLLSSMLDNTKSSANCGSGRNLDPESETFCCLSLKALTHLFMWVPITNNITPNLMGAIFRLASISSDTSRDESVRTLAMAAINEILYKNCVPASCADFVLNLLQQAMTLLQGWLASPEDIDLQDSYEEKLIEFLRLFVGLHLTRLEDNPCFPMADFADLLLKFTFHGESTEHLVACLEVWDTFLSHLQFKKNVAQWGLLRYSDVLISLVKQLLGKCQFRTNQAPLEELDDDTLNDDNQTEWQNFLCDCIDIIDKVITIVPDTTYELLYGNWEQVCKVYVGLQHVICSDTNTQARQLGVKSEHDIGRMHCYMRDLSSLTQIMGRLSAHQIDDFTHGNVIVPLLLNLANFAFEQQLHRLLVSTPVLTTDFVEVYVYTILLQTLDHAQVLAALKSWCHWMVPVERHNLIPGLLGSVVPILTTPGEPAKLCHSAAHLLATITAMARPPQIWELEIIRDLYRLVPTLQNLQPETQVKVSFKSCDAITGCLATQKTEKKVAQSTPGHCGPGQFLGQYLKSSNPCTPKGGMIRFRLNTQGEEWGYALCAWESNSPLVRMSGGTHVLLTVRVSTGALKRLNAQMARHRPITPGARAQRPGPHCAANTITCRHLTTLPHRVNNTVVPVIMAGLLKSMPVGALVPAEPFVSARHFLTTAEMFLTNNFNTYRLVQRAMCNTLLLVWPGVSDQLWDQRHKLLSALLDSLVSDFRRLGANPPPQIPDSQVGPIITNTLRLLGDLVNITQEEGSASRKLLYSVIQANVHQSLAMFPQYIQCGDVCEAILNFFLTAFSGLTQQLGAPFTEQTVQTFLNMFTREQVQASLGQEGGAGTRVIDKFLQLLQLVMAEPGAAFKGFVSSTIKLCLDHIFPLVCDSPSPDIKMALFTVLHTILLYRWQHFYRASVLESLSSGAGVSDNVNHREHLAGILQAYGQTLLQADINMFAHNLRSLEQVNGKWKLYQKKLFREELLPQFLTVLLHTLLNKSHSLLGDDIAVAIFNMAAVDFPAFHDAFIPHFLRTTSGLDDNQRTILQRNFKRDMDLPSFTQNILRLMNDMRCYRLCNASLPANSVKL
uniref:Importin N-terminal domain-containing protein n=2 Tax=Timema TaxID=61471 RepID=A0A7R9E556_9NEOP|nr:unnamed protein product [Timema monikensis]